MKNKIISRQKIQSLSGQLKIRGKKIVFTNGCFDILHIGHIRLINEAKKMGDILILGLNSDSSIRKNKGSGRPIINQVERSEILASLGSVDYLVIFNEKSVHKLISQIKPDVLVKGGDYQKEGVVGWEIVESYGGKVEIIDCVKDRSTSAIIQKIQNKKQKKASS